MTSFFGFPVPSALLALAAVSLSACGDAGDVPSHAGSAASVSRDVASLPARIVVAAPDRPILNMDTVEDHSESVANRFVEFADKIRRRDFSAARDWISPDFAGTGFSGLEVEQESSLPLDTRSVAYAVDSARVVNRDGFLASISAWIGPWSRIEMAQWKVKGAEFQTGMPAWGRIRFKTTILGAGENGEPRSIVGWGHARVEKANGNWMLAEFELSSLQFLERRAPLFTDVATSAGVAHSGIRFGKNGNQSFAWNGAAAGDVDGDGLWDLFVPSTPKNFLYMGRREKDGVANFVDEAAERGVQLPEGGTGAVFFDLDNDGDQDLAVADVGWATGGNPLRLYRNDGTGKFADASSELGFTGHTNAYSLVVFDADGDGWLDLFVCNYGRVDAEPNNSWIQATNGTQNRLYINQAGKGFREEALARGLEDHAWSYAAAAADYDQDGDVDLYVANDYGVNHLWNNDGRGHFRDASPDSGVQDLGNGMGAGWGDMNNDGGLDLYVSNMSSTAGNRILKRLAKKDDTWGHLMKLAAGNTIFLSAQTDGGAFERASSEMGGTGGSWAWSSALADLDLDGRLDIYCCSGFVTGDTAADT